MKNNDRKTIKNIILDFLIKGQQKTVKITYEQIPLLKMIIESNLELINNKKEMDNIQKLIDKTVDNFIKEKLRGDIDNIIKKSDKDIQIDNKLLLSNDKTNFYNINKITDEDIKKISKERKQKYINEKILDFIKDKKRVPKYTELRNLDLSKFIKNNKTYIIFIINFLENYITNLTASAPRMKILFKEEYIKNKDLFNKFMVLNIQNIIDASFQEIGKEVKDIIENIENEVVKKMENSQHAYGSSSLHDKFYNFVKIFFPKYDFIGVTIKKKGI